MLQTVKFCLLIMVLFTAGRLSADEPRFQLSGYWIASGEKLEAMLERKQSEDWDASVFRQLLVGAEVRHYATLELTLGQPAEGDQNYIAAQVPRYRFDETANAMLRDGTDPVYGGILLEALVTPEENRKRDDAYRLELDWKMNTITWQVLMDGAVYPQVSSFGIKASLGMLLNRPLFQASDDGDGMFVILLEPL